MLSFDTNGGVHPQDDIIINQHSGGFSFYQTPLNSTPGILNFQNGEKLKHPSEHTIT